MEIEKINLKEKGQLFNDTWSPRIIGELNQQQVKLAKFEGEFGWHCHTNEDELFLVVEGQIEIRLRNKTIQLNKGEFLIVPRGIEHNPYATSKSLVLLFEPSTIVKNGDSEK